MATFFFRLNAPRPSFALDLNEAERQLMQQHAIYWHGALARGNIVVFGMVGDPNGAFGVGIGQFDNEAEARSFADNDPTVKAGAGFSVDVFPMPMGAVHPAFAASS